MRYVTSTEPYKTNLALVAELHATLTEIINTRFQTSPKSVRDAIERIDDLEALRALRTRALTAQTAEDFERAVAEHAR